MESKKNKIRLLFIAMVGFVLYSCLDDKFESVNQEQETEVDTVIQEGQYAGFDFNTVVEYDVVIKALNSLNMSIGGVYIELFTEIPLDSSGLLIEEIDEHQVFKGVTDKNGLLQCQVSLPSYIDSLYVLTYYIGLAPLYTVALTNSHVDIVLGGQNHLKSEKTVHSGANLKNLSAKPPTKVNGFYTLGKWNKYGVPNYLENTNDQITTSLLDDINASLPERSPLPDTHPQYLTNSAGSNLVLLENCEVWVTFVHEGAGWHNSLGYYTYPTNNSPASVDDINDLTIIFPDVSAYSNGLTPGNKVQLSYLNPETNQFTNTFPSGVTVGWFLIAQGWSSNSQTVTNGVYTHFSDVNLNVESNSDLKKHNVLLFDEARDLLLLGFEDIRRDNSGCDQDFNDAIFYASINPITAINKNSYQVIDTPVDSDGDGVSDTFDEFPFDANNSFNNYYPSENGFATLIFEDMWPSKGDYDFNDLVVDYNFNQVTNSQNKIVAIRTKIKVKAIGASYHNAFGISFNTTPSNITSVSGQINTKGYLNIAANGTEQGQSKAVIIFFDDAFNVLPYPGVGICVNTYPEYPYVTPTIQEVDIVFNTPLGFGTLGTPPYNPFIIVNRIRGKEIHLIDKEPTDLVNLSLFGTVDDDSNISTGSYYVSDYLPWVINLPESFSYPLEKQDIIKTHLMFDNWAGSWGSNYTDWYQNKTDYRNNGKIYSK